MMADLMTFYLTTGMAIGAVAGYIIGRLHAGLKGKP